MQVTTRYYSFSDGQRKEIANELVIEYPESLLNVNMIDNDSRNIKNEVEMDHRMKYVDYLMVTSTVIDGRVGS